MQFKCTFIIAKQILKVYVICYKNLENFLCIILITRKIFTIGNIIINFTFHFLCKPIDFFIVLEYNFYDVLQ